MRINSLAIEGFRVFSQREELDLSCELALGYGPNSKGKTSLAEAIEFLLCGTTSRRDLVASTKTEFAEGLKNVHYNGPTYVEATVALDTSKEPILVKRRLVSDYPDGNNSCASKLERFDGDAWVPFEWADVGMESFDNPVRLPIIFQHTLRYVSGAKQSERREYFQRLLDVQDITDFREFLRTNAAVPLEKRFEAMNNLLDELSSYSQFGVLASSIRSSRSLGDVEALLLKQISELLPLDRRPPAGAEPHETTDALRQYVDWLRRHITGLPLFELPKPVEPWTNEKDFVDAASKRLDVAKSAASKQLQYDELITEQTRLLWEFLRAGLALPQTSRQLDTPIDCPFCLTEQALSGERIDDIRAQLAKPNKVRLSIENTIAALDAVDQLAGLVVNFVQERTPHLITEIDRDKVGSLLAANPEKVDPWKRALDGLLNVRAKLLATATVLRGAVRKAQDVSAQSRLPDLEAIGAALTEVASAYDPFVVRARDYDAVAADVQPIIADATNAIAQLDKFDKLLAIWDGRHLIPDLIIEVEVNRHVNAQLEAAVKEITSANSKVLRDDKFPPLSKDIVKWWDMLRPGEQVAFSDVRPKGNALREIDLKANLVAAAADGSESAVERDAVAVFSDSQLNCLGLALFLARAEREGTGFVVLDDPIQSLDSDHSEFLVMNCVKELLETLGFQVIILTHDNAFWDRLRAKYLHRDTRGFRILADVDTGQTTILGYDSNFAEIVKDIGQIAAVPSNSIYPIFANKLRIGCEAFCKEVIVRNGNAEAKAKLPRRFDGKMLPELLSAAGPHLTRDAADLGTLRHIEETTNPGSHDNLSKAPSNDVQKALAGELRQLGKKYDLLPP